MFLGSRAARARGGRLAAFLVVPESRDPAVPARWTYAGLVLSVAMLGLLVWTIIEAPERGWASTATDRGFAVSAVLLVAFVIVERRRAHPMLDMTLFADRRFSAASGAVTVTFFSLFGFIFLITQYFQFIRGYGALSTGARILPVALSIAVASDRRCDAGSPDRDPRRRDHRAGAVRNSVPVDLQRRTSHVVRRP